LKIGKEKDGRELLIPFYEQKRKQYSKEGNKIKKDHKRHLQRTKN
jgi:hypothetical protein